MELIFPGPPYEVPPHPTKPKNYFLSEENGSSCPLSAVGTVFWLCATRGMVQTAEDGTDVPLNLECLDPLFQTMENQSPVGSWHGVVDSISNPHWILLVLFAFWHTLLVKIPIDQYLWYARPMHILYNLL